MGMTALPIYLPIMIDTCSKVLTACAGTSIIFMPTEKYPIDIEVSKYEICWHSAGYRLGGHSAPFRNLLQSALVPADNCLQVIWVSIIQKQW